MIQLPAPVAAYVEATNRDDAEGVARCFTADGTVHDEGAVHRGAGPIAAWVRDSAARYQARMEPASLTGGDDQWRLLATVSGNFRGSPATLRFDFTLHGDAIAALEIGV